MAMLDVFKSDAFSTVSLTAAINKLPYKPAKLGAMNIFKKDGITTLDVAVEEQHGKLALVPSKARGAAGTPFSGKNRNARSFRVIHLPLSGEVKADDVQSIRAFGSENTTTPIVQLINDKLTDMRQSMEFTHEYHRVGAIQGLLLDADGSTLYDWFDEFGITQNTTEVDWGETNSVKTVANDVIRTIEDALGMTPYQHIHAICGDTFYDALTIKAETKTAFDRWNEGQFLRDNQTRKVFEYAGIFWENYRGKIGATPFIDADEIYCFPVGAPDVFQEVYAPADYVETVNTKGLPTYAKQERMKMDKGVELEVQSNPLIFCSRPATLVKVTHTGTVPT